MNIVKKIVAHVSLEQAHAQARRHVWNLGQCIRAEGKEWHVSRILNGQEVACALGTDAVGRVWGFDSGMAVDLELGRELANDCPSTVAIVSNVSCPRADRWNAIHDHLSQEG